MTYGENGSVIGPQNLPTSSAAPGVWSLGEIAESVRDGIWPAPDNITKFGLLTLPTGKYPKAEAMVIDLDTSGNPVVMLPNYQFGNNYIVEIDKSSWAFTYMRDYTTAGSSVGWMQFGINPSDNSMIAFGMASNGTSSMLMVNLAYIVKSGSTGWDDFQRYGTSNDGYFLGSMGGFPWTYQNYSEGGRVTFKPAADYPITTDDYYFDCGGRWTTGSPYYARFGVYVNDNAVAPTINGYAFNNDSGYNGRSAGACGMVGTSAAVWGMDSTYWGRFVLVTHTISSSGSNNNYTNSATGFSMDGFDINGKTRIGNEGHTGTQRMPGGFGDPNQIAIQSENGGDLKIGMFSQGADSEWAAPRKITPTTFGNDAYPMNTGPIVSNDGVYVYSAWASNNSDASDRGWIIIASHLVADGTLQWQNRLTWADANEGTNTRFNYGSMKLMTTDSADDSLVLTSQLYQTTSPSFREQVPIIRLRTDGMGHGTYNFTETGSAGGAISFTYAADTSPEAAVSGYGKTTYNTWYNPGALYGNQGSESSANAAVTSGYSWSTS